MKRFLFAVLALAGFAACSSDSDLNEVVTPELKETLTIYATQQSFDTTRVSIDFSSHGEPTVLSWDEGDPIKLVTENGISATLNAEDVDGKNAIFRTTEPVGYVKEDTYYAGYPSSNSINTSTFLYSVPATQTGLAKNAVVLYGEGDTDAETEGVQMSFKPVNAVLFVTVKNAPTNGFKSMVIRGYDNENISGQVEYNNNDGSAKLDLIANNTITINGSEENNYLKNGLYISMPAGVSFSTGYTLSFTTQDNEQMAFAFGASSFEMGKVYGAEVPWTIPTVTLGAKSSYSYAAAVNGVATASPSTANGMDGLTLYFSESYKSSFSGVQNAMIEDCGFIVDGTEYSVSNGKVTRNGKEFWMNNLTGQTKTNHTVKAYIKIKHNDTIIPCYSAEESIAVTGIPYSVSLTSQPGDWSFSGDYRFSGYGTDAGAGNYLRFKGDSDNSADSAISPKFYIPTNTNVKAIADCYHYCSNVFASNKNATIYINICNGSRPTSTSNGTTYNQSLSFNDFGNHNDAVANLTLTNANCYVGITHSTPTVTGNRWMCVQSFKVEYR